MKEINNIESKPMSEKEITEHFNVSSRTFYNYRKHNKFTVGVEYYYVGKQIRYNLKEVTNYFIEDSKR